MTTSISPAYYMMMTGASLTVLTAIVMILSPVFNTYYGRSILFGELNLVTSFLLTLIPGAAALLLSHLYYARPPTRLIAGLSVAGFSVVSLIGAIGSGIVLYEGVLFSGPPISFAGGLIGAFLSRTKD